MTNSRRTIRRLALALAWVAGCVNEDASDGGSSETGPSEPHVTFIVHVPSSACDTVGVVTVQVRARRVGCEPPVPCTVPANPPDILGDVATCPITDPERTLGVDVLESGRYLVDTIADRSPDDPVYECQGLDMQMEVSVTAVDLEVDAQKDLTALGKPCDM